MLEVKGKYTTALVQTEEVEEYALAQIRQLCDQPAFEGAKIRMMPDVHPGKVGPIGFTAVVQDKIMPAVVGVDIGCGMKVALLRTKKMEFQKLDTLIRERIPAGFGLRSTPHRFAERIDFEKLAMGESFRREMALRGIGTLGGGNHFIEVDRDEEGNLYVVIHTGSRHFGKEVADHYLSVAHRQCAERGISVPYELSWLEGREREDYLQDVALAQEYAALNRQAILDELVKGMKWKVEEEMDCVHNYVTQDPSGQRILRKGAISAQEKERVIIPVNMRDGVLLGAGKGNPDWNCSAPHGAGRIMDRERVRSSFTVSQYKKEMKGIFTTCIGKETLDEAPFAYRSLDYLLKAVEDTVEVQKVLRPVYNYKGGGET